MLELSFGLEIGGYLSAASRGIAVDGEDPTGHCSVPVTKVVRRLVVIYGWESNVALVLLASVLVSVLMLLSVMMIPKEMANLALLL